jgi:iron complex transport system ATP-binding protein
MNKAILKLQDLSIGYFQGRRSRAVVAEGLSVSLHEAELVCLLGPNGAGKSTLMRTIAGMQAPLAGQALLLGTDIHRLKAQELARRLSVVLTERVSVGILSAYALVTLGRHPHTNWAGTLTDKDHDVVRWAIQTVGAQDLAHRPVGELSDGERQKVMVARALAQEPEVMILDEVTAFLDLPRRVEIMRLLREIAHLEGTAILLSTHDLDLALRSADRIWLLSKGGALQVGAPEELVLSGAFGDAFASEGVAFDERRGSFRINEHHGAGEVGVTGDEIGALWTVRALERCGFSVAENGDAVALSVEVLRQHKQVTWFLNAGGQKQSYSSLADLLGRLKTYKASA